MNSEPNIRKIEGTFAIPGDRLATIEEFEAGSGAVTSGEEILASTAGFVSKDMSNRIISVMPPKRMNRLPHVGDFIVGKVESASPSVAQVNIQAIDEVESNKEFSAMLSLREDRRRRFSPGIKPGDFIRAMIVSTTNSIFQLGIECENCGVVYTVCSVCGGNVIALGKDRIKCRECGTVDERLLSSDFLAQSRTEGTA
jgi:exosome complex component CSL4